MSRPIDAFSKHVELLRPLLAAKAPLHVMADNSSAEERQLLLEMKNAGFIECLARSDEMGRPSDFGNIVVTIAGRALVAEFDKPEEKKTNWPMISVLLALAVFAAAVFWKLAEVSAE